MAAEENRRRKKKKTKGADDQRLWGSLFSEEGKSEKIPANGEAGDEEESSGYLLVELWRRFNFWSLLAAALFLVFTGSLAYVVVRMWTPQNLRDVAGYTDKGKAKDISSALKNGGGKELIFTEGEVNRFLRDTCRMRQTGLFSIIAHAQGVAVRFHDGYAELVIDRLLGANIHQTTAVNLSFQQVMEHGRPSLQVSFCGGDPIFGNMPRGGRIGRVAVPERHIRMLQPALMTLLACYPDITSAFDQYGYRPVFTAGGRGTEGTVRLVPQSTSSETI